MTQTKATHTPTTEMRAILDIAKSTQSDIMISALAGTGKTTTLSLLANELNPTSPALSLAFNTRAAEELKEKFPKSWTVQTLNSLGHLAWYTNLRRGLTVDKFKLGKLTTAAFREAGINGSKEDWQSVQELVTLSMNSGLVPNEYPLYKKNALLLDSRENWLGLAQELDHYPGEWIIPVAQKVLNNSIKAGFGGTISYDDQIYLSSLFGGKFPQYPLVLVDEAQDLSILNRVMISKTATGRLILVGDKNQCFIPGTMIEVTHKTAPWAVKSIDTIRTKNAEFDFEGVNLEIPSIEITTKSEALPIEDIQVGQQIVNYSSRDGYFKGQKYQGRKVLEKKEFHFEGDLISISAFKFKHLCTPNHRCLVRIPDTTKYCLYIMKKGDFFKIGISKASYENVGFGPAMRCRQEEAEAIWILATYENKEEARLEEMIASVQFGIPEFIFLASSDNSIPQNLLDEAWKRIGPNAKNAVKCLTAFGRDINYPLYTHKKGKNNSKMIGKYSFITEACNLITDLMYVKTYNGDPRNADWYPSKIERIPYSGKVIGLTVEADSDNRRTYIANGIVTHNSIYGWRGADTNSLANLKSLRSDWIELPLSTTFRCPKVVVARQHLMVPNYTAAEGNSEGQFHDLRFKEWSWEDIKSISKNKKVTILCRNNAPLLSMAFKLIKSRVGVNLLKRNLSSNLGALAKKLLTKKPNSIWPSTILSWIQSESEILILNKKSHKIDQIEDRGECLLAIIEANPEISTLPELLSIIDEMFSEPTGLVTLSTIHSFKGLESDTVVHLDPFRIPSKYVTSEDLLKQEENLRYVAETRTKDILILANLRDFHVNTNSNRAPSMLQNPTNSDSDNSSNLTA